MAGDSVQAERCDECGAPVRLLDVPFCGECGAASEAPVPAPHARFDEEAEFLVRLAEHPDLPAVLTHRPGTWGALVPHLVFVGCALAGTVGVLLALQAVGRSSGADWVLLGVGGLLTVYGLLRLLDVMRHPVERHVAAVVATAPPDERTHRPADLRLRFENGDVDTFARPADAPADLGPGDGGVAFVRARHLLAFRRLAAQAAQ